MTRPRHLELCCKAGGSAFGLHLAGFEVVGIDINYQKNYPFEFFQADVLEILEDTPFINSFESIGGGVPCQGYSVTQRIMDNDHPDLIPPVREKLLEIGKPYVLENVPGAPLIDPVEMCGCMFPELNVYRERWFEMPWWTAPRPDHKPHLQRQTKMGRLLEPGTRMHVVGHFNGVEDAKEAMQIDWMTRDELAEAIPPAYTHFIGAELMKII